MNKYKVAHLVKKEIFLTPSAYGTNQYYSTSSFKETKTPWKWFCLFGNVQSTTYNLAALITSSRSSPSYNKLFTNH